MKDTPLLFSDAMALAMVENRKRHTRRLNGLQEVNWKPDEWLLQDLSVDPLIDFQNGPRVMKGLIATFEHVEGGDCFVNIRCPFGQVGDRIWGREAWAYCCKCGQYQPQNPKGVIFRADGCGFSTCHICDPVTLESVASARWRPSIFMPRWASRIERELVGIRLERLQAISGKDCIREGIGATIEGKMLDGSHVRYTFRELWDSINKARGYPWEHNPWVWVLEFGVK